MNIVAILGRPNTGKSSLFKKVSGKKDVIIDETAGVTRDRLYCEVKFADKTAVFVDTGGFEPDKKEGIKNLILKQTEAAIDEADLLVVLFDSKAGVHPDDTVLVEKLRREKKHIVYAVNKVDSGQGRKNVLDFYSLGIGDFHSISAADGTGVSGLLSDVFARLKFDSEKEEEELKKHIGLAVIGRPNVGKSSLVNRILKYDRVMVHPEPGTTRDPVDTAFEYESKNYILIDTAGIRRRSKIDDNLEARTVISALRSVERANIAILVVDASREIAVQDLRISNYALEKGKALIVVVNKMDLIEEHEDIDYTAFREKVLRIYPSLSFCPFIFASVKSGMNIEKVMSTVKSVCANYEKKVETRELNRFLKEISVNEKLGYVKGKKGVRAKIKYMTQKGGAPPRFVIFTNSPKHLKERHLSFLRNSIREKFKFEGVPIFISFKKE